jgi:hypothetical protein
MRRNLIVTIATVLTMVAIIFYVRENPLFTISFFETNYLNNTFVYQVTTLLLSFVIILIIGFLTKFKSISLLSLKKIDGEVIPEPWIGISKNNKDSWKKIGFSIGLIITIITGIVIYFQVFQNGIVNNLNVLAIIVILLFALINSFVEEVTFRHTFTSVNIINRILIFLRAYQQ